LDGSLVHDSHAEVLAKRAFVIYILNHLEQSIPNSVDDNTTNAKSIFEYLDNSGQFILKEGIKFHFYSSHPPCGDATIAPKQFVDVSTSNDEDPDSLHLENKRIKLEHDNVEDIHRTGAKCIKQSIIKDPLKTTDSRKDYHVFGAVRRKPGRGDPTESLSCSDKMAKWNIVGLQGSLLSSLLSNGPLLWSSLVVSSPQCNIESMNRSIFNRFNASTKIVKKIPIVKSEITFQFSKDAENGLESLKHKGLFPCSSNIAFSQSGGHVLCHDVLVNGRKQGITKKHFGTPKSSVSICRLNLSKRFVELLRNVHNRCSDKTSCDICTTIKDKLKYSDLKLLCQEQCTWYRNGCDTFYSILPGLKEARLLRRKRIDDFYIA
jgi:tRNA-specific adenosine deaminase 1